MIGEQNETSCRTEGRALQASALPSGGYPLLLGLVVGVTALRVGVLLTVLLLLLFVLLIGLMVTDRATRGGPGHSMP
jgi:hypothetical protein